MTVNQCMAERGARLRRAPECIHSDSHLRSVSGLPPILLDPRELAHPVVPLTAGTSFPSHLPPSCHILAASLPLGPLWKLHAPSLSHSRPHLPHFLKKAMFLGASPLAVKNKMKEHRSFIICVSLSHLILGIKFLSRTLGQGA